MYTSRKIRLNCRSALKTDKSKDTEAKKKKKKKPKQKLERKKNTHAC